MAIGRVGSYATDAPLNNNYIGDALTMTENQGFRYRQERRQIAEAKKAEEETKQNAVTTDLQLLKEPITTKFSSHNALAIDGAGKLFNGVAQKGREMLDGKISKVEYEIYKQNAMNQFNLMNQASKRINEQGQEYSKLLETGKIASGFEQEALSLGKAYEDVKMQWELGEDGTLVAVAYDDSDPNNVKIVEKGDLSKFGQNSFTPIFAYDLDKDKQEFLKTYPKVLTENFGATTKTGIKGITPEIEEAIDLKVDAIVKDRNSLAVTTAKRTGVPKSKITDPEEVEKTRQSLKKEFLAMYSQEKTVDEALGRANLEQRRVEEANRQAERKRKAEEAKARAKAKSQQRKDNIPSMENNVTGGGVVIRNTNDTTGAGNTLPKEVQKGDKAYSINGLQISYNKGKTVRAIKNVYLNPKTNKMVFSGVDINIKGVETPFKSTNTDEQAQFINKVVKKYDENDNPIYYKTVDEFARDLKNKPSQLNEGGGDYDNL